MPPFSPGSRLIVLGAGATRGANFGAAAGSCLPPLNRDFLTQLQRTTEPKYQRLIRDVIEDIVELFGSNFDLTLEDYFTQLEFLDDALNVGPQSAGTISPAKLRRKRGRLLHAVSAVLEISTDAAIRGGGHGCSHHSRLVEKLKARDTLISFNYDCVLDHALRQHGSKKWSAAYGYTFPRPGRVEGVVRWDPSSPAKSSKETIFLLKLHGSLNWQLPDDPKTPDVDHQQTIVLKERLHGQRGVPYFTIIPPVWNKAASEHPTFKVLWRNAERAIRMAREIAVVGFSFASTDLPVESLFRVALARRTTKLKTLVIANGSKVDRARTRKVFARPLEDGTVVRQYDDFGSFAEAFPSCFN
jgi:SIR2-like domain